MIFAVFELGNQIMDGLFFNQVTQLKCHLLSAGLRKSIELNNKLVNYVFENTVRQSDGSLQIIMES